MAIEIASFPSQNCNFPQFCQRLPDGNLGFASKWTKQIASSGVIKHGWKPWTISSETRGYSLSDSLAAIDSATGPTFDQVWRVYSPVNYKRPWKSPVQWAGQEPMKIGATYHIHKAYVLRLRAYISKIWPEIWY